MNAFTTLDIWVVAATLMFMTALGFGIAKLLFLASRRYPQPEAHGEHYAADHVPTGEMHHGELVRLPDASVDAGLSAERIAG